VNLKRKQETNSTYYRLAALAIGWGTAWSLSWILINDTGAGEALPLIALSGAVGGIIVGFGQTAYMRDDIGCVSYVWLIV